MKILIVEDTKKNIEAAKKQLAGHQLTILSSFKQFINLTGNNTVGAPASAPWKYESLSEYDMVLTDVELPSFTDNSPNDEALAPTGLMIMTKALSDGVKYIGVITDANHHMDPVSRGFDFYLHSIVPISLGQSKLFLMGCDACKYPSDRLYPSEYRNYNREKMIESGEASAYENKDKEEGEDLIIKDPFFDEFDCLNFNERGKNWARLFRILTEDYRLCDLLAYEQRDLYQKMLDERFKK